MVTVQDTNAGTTCTMTVVAAFVFIGAAPCTRWLGDTLVIDDDGFLVTGDALQLTHLDPAGDVRQCAPSVLETAARESSPSAMCAPARPSASPRRPAREQWPCCYCINT
jgi:thioredoxin reductase